ncbi:type 12 methyltransferase [Fulvitalea axinellae]|uniref:Type 12 methyltransferase n=1 Tax=Fulvitalea axinellae TaxID=1182444 RepID=A0AAU9DCB8_9BACT|nr:type 12 methyltransferase [Fulvitalea axinellae]
MEKYIEENKSLWNARTEVHVNSEFYDIPSFMGGACSLKPIELDLLGDLKGKKVLHLQCHFGQDTLSMARRGAKVTGVDLSDVAIAKARALASELDLDAKFVCCDVFDLENHLQGDFDIVFTSYGTIGWLPELKTWGNLIAKYLKPGGRFVMAEFHPVVWMFDDYFKEVTYPYFNVAPIVETSTETYTDGDEGMGETTFHVWNHALSDVMGALLSKGLSINEFLEFDYSPYDCFKNTVKTENGYQIKGFEGKLPMVYALVAEKS